VQGFFIPIDGGETDCFVVVEGVGDEGVEGDFGGERCVAKDSGGGLVEVRVDYLIAELLAGL